jgi:HEAT repeat protein/beta-lactamase regulating signal transducer with metallopeptidase domain
VTPSFASGALAWLLTYALHSTVLLGLAWLVLRLRRAEPATADVLWKVAMIGALLTASAQTALNIAPTGSVSLIAAAEAGPSTTSQLTSLQNDALVSPSAASEQAGSSVESNPSTSTAAPVTAGRGWNFSTAGTLATVWAVLALGLVLWYVGRRLILVGRLGDRRVVHEPSLTALLADLKREAGVTRHIVLTASQTISSPVALGTNEICLPAAAMDELDPAQQRAMLAHELAHLVRRDPQWLGFACLMERAFFFQPLNRLARRGMQQSAEYLADEWAAQRSGGVPLARCLVKVAEWIQASPLGVPVAGMAEERSQLASRVSRLLESTPLGAPRSRRPLAFLSTGALLAMVMFAPGVVGRAASPEDLPTDLFGTNPASEVKTSLDDFTDENVDEPAAYDDKGLKGAKGDKSSEDYEYNYSSDEYNVDDLSSQVDGKVITAADTAVVRALIARLRDDDKDVRQAAAHALGRIGNVMAINPLVATLDDSEPEVVRASLDALSNFERGVPVAPIRRMLASGDAEIRQCAAQILGQMRDRESIPSLARLVRDQDSNVRQEAIQALTEIGDPTATSAIAAALDDTDPDVRQEAIEGMAELGGTVPDAVVQRALRDVSKEVRDAAIHLVEEHRMVSMVPELIRMLDDPSAEIRECAAEALTEMKTEQSHAALRNAMTHRDAAVRRIAVQYFGEENDS